MTRPLDSSVILRQDSAAVACIKEAVVELAGQQQDVVLLPEDAAELLDLLQIRLLKKHNLNHPQDTEHDFHLALAVCIVPTAVADRALPAKLARDLMATASRSDTEICCLN